eukprot:TRINITY_DN10163_c0_g1_i1.p1 TRINITY_DN10163_c0_g1~~TRINITY_DN10163_c0_g1_i1.p1  ORF type:complete len:350 (+),score=112.51 TRINITY_DN10163_c0_g1_i1:114-1163(+)
MKTSLRVARPTTSTTTDAEEDTTKKMTALDMLNASLEVPSKKLMTSSQQVYTKPILTAPIDSRYIIGTEACLNVKLLSANKLHSKDGKSEPFVRLRQADNVWNSKTCVASDAPEFNESVCLAVIKPQVNLLLIEVFEKDKVGRKNLLGYTVIDLSLLPKEIPVTTTEQLSGSACGEITICLKAIDFGLDNIKPEYIAQYLSWRSILLPVGRRGNVKSRRASAALPSSSDSDDHLSSTTPSLSSSTPSLSSSTPSVSAPSQRPRKPMPAALSGDGGAVKATRRKSVSGDLSASTPVFSKDKSLKKREPGPYGARCVPGSYSIENGYVKKNPSPFTKVLHKLQKLNLFKDR